MEERTIMNKQTESESSHGQMRAYGQALPQSVDQDDEAKSSQASGAEAAEDDEQFDPVCGMAVDVTHEMSEHFEHDGKTYYFCSADCREQYEASPDEFDA
jgi:YHS domain-containing protein